MNKIIFNPDKSLWATLTQRPKNKALADKKFISNIFNEVKKNGDLALEKYTYKYDGLKLKEFKLSQSQIKKSKNNLNYKLKESIIKAYKNIRKFHQSQKVEYKKILIQDGVKCWMESKPISKVGLYIPGGTAPLFSSLLMMGVPAQIANCDKVIICTPPNQNLHIQDEILFAAELCGIEDIYTIGGAQAIAAMAVGTETIPKVEKIFGPGNQYVTESKIYASLNGCAIDLPAGPSELLVVVDKNSNPKYVAADLLSQAEHGADSQVVLVSLSKNKIEDVIKEVDEQIKNLSRRKIIKRSLENSLLVYFDSKNDAANFINYYAPEHYIIHAIEEDFFVSSIVNAGSVFIGQFSPESAGDYISGTNHVLPTNGFAKQYSGVNLDSFYKKISFQKISKKGLMDLSENIKILAKAEKLDAHANAVSVRFKDEN